MSLAGAAMLALACTPTAPASPATGEGVEATAVPAVTVLPETVPDPTVPPVTVPPEPAPVAEPGPPTTAAAPGPEPEALIARDAPITHDAPSSMTAAPSGNGAVHAAATVVLERGHVDLIEVTVDGAQLRVSVKDDTQPSGPVYRSPNEVQLRLPASSLIAVPPGPFGFLGPEGSPVHLLPQVQDPELVWPGWSTERLSAGQLAGDSLRMRLVGVDGPGPLALFTTDQFGSPTVLWDSDGGSANEFQVPIRTHAHANWAFGEAGVYRVTVEVTGTIAGAGPAATTATYVFLVGDAAAPVPPESVPAPQTATPDALAQGGAPSASTGATAGSGASDGASTSTSGSTSGGAANAASSGRGAGSGASGSLASTGSSSVPLAVGGALLVLVGACATVVDRRRARRSTT
jgi:surface-anchored protein